MCATLLMQSIRMPSSPTARASPNTLDIETKQKNITILHHVLLSFLPHQALVLHALPTTIADEVVVARRFRLDEPALEVAVDHPGRLRRRITAMDRPRAHLLLAGREICLQAEQVETAL